MANVGVHGLPAALHLEDLELRSLTKRTGLVGTSSTPRLLELVASGAVDASRFVAHHFWIHEVLAASDTSTRAGETGALEVVVER